MFLSSIKERSLSRVPEGFSGSFAPRRGGGRLNRDALKAIPGVLGPLEGGQGRP
jgi:hypothetical protein